MENLAEEYYRWAWGCYPHENKVPLRKTQCVIEYLQDNNWEDADILELLTKAPKREYLSPNDLPDSLWENSLIKRDTFYYHRILQIVSPPPVWRPGKPVMPTALYVEMRIHFTMNDLFQYATSKLEIPMYLWDIKKESGALRYLLKKYEKAPFAESLDILLFLIDKAADSGRETTDILSAIQWVEAEGIKELETRCLQAQGEGKNHIIWRK